MNETNEKILDRLDKYRELEIQNLWQRSVFLGAFLILGYTGYGILVDKMLSTEYQELQLLHFFACIVACVNIIFSVLWIAMAKGSKAWYEAYENAIAFVENSNQERYSWKEIRCEIDLRKRITNTAKCESRMDLNKFEKNLKNDCLFSTKAGGYSPAKINIALGQISFFIWVIVLITHIAILCTDTYKMISKDTLVFLLSLIVLSTICIISNLSINKCNEWIESGYFSDKIKK